MLRDVSRIWDRLRDAWVYERRWLGILAAGLLVAAGLGVAAYLLLSEDDEGAEGPAPRVVIRQEEPEAAQDLGFPAFATKNTTRVAGGDPVADAAGIALATFPSTGGIEGPPAVTLVTESDWQAGIAAAALAGPPVRAPVLVSGTDDVPELTEDAIRALAPGGAGITDDRQVFRVGDATAPAGLRVEDVKGENIAELAAAIDALRQRLTGSDPEHIVLASADRPEYAMPAAGWAARSGDPVLFVQRESAPKATLEAIEKHPGVPVFVLGPDAAVSDKALAAVRKVAPDAARIGAATPAANAIAFARYVSGSFGWNINDPGHGFVIANTERPLDAAAAATLSASGTWGPLLVTEDPDAVPDELRGYLLDVKPGYESDPTRAVYNHIWLIGDESAISVPFQAQVDDLGEVAPVGSGTGQITGAPSSEGERQR
jgi:hypothetical protein